MKSQVSRRLYLMGAVLFLVLLTGTLGFSSLEGISLIDALYFSVVTVATVGYGDIHPVTPEGRLLAVGIIVCGVGTFLYVVANGTELLMESRQEVARKEKLNMVIGLFFAEVGFDLLKFFAAADAQCGDVRATFAIDQKWEGRHFSEAERNMKRLCMKVNPLLLDKNGLRDFLRVKSDLLLRILENQNLSEHGEFTELMRAVFHLKAELVGRHDLNYLPETDLNHLAGDVERAYLPLTRAWLHHMRYLKNQYPYLYSLAVRTNPFNPDASAIVT